MVAVPEGSGGWGGAP